MVRDGVHHGAAEDKPVEKGTSCDAGRVRFGFQMHIRSLAEIVSSCFGRMDHCDKSAKGGGQGGEEGEGTIEHHFWGFKHASIIWLKYPLLADLYLLQNLTRGLTTVNKHKLTLSDHGAKLE